MSFTPRQVNLPAHLAITCKLAAEVATLLKHDAEFLGREGRAHPSMEDTAGLQLTRRPWFSSRCAASCPVCRHDSFP